MNHHLSEAEINAGFDAYLLFSTSKIPKLIEAYKVAKEAPSDEQRDLRFYLIGWMDAMSQVVTMMKAKRVTVERALEEAQAAKDNFHRLAKICKGQLAQLARGEKLPEGALLNTINGLMEVPRQYRDEGFFVLGWVDRLEIFRHFRETPDQHQRN